MNEKTILAMKIQYPKIILAMYEPILATSKNGHQVLVCLPDF